MRPFDDDNDDLDDFEFDSFAASHRLLRDRLLRDRLLRDRHHHRKFAGRKRHKAVHKERWESEEFDSPDDFYEAYSDEFDGYYGSKIDH